MGGKRSEKEEESSSKDFTHTVLCAFGILPEGDRGRGAREGAREGEREGDREGGRREKENKMRAGGGRGGKMGRGGGGGGGGEERRLLGCVRYSLTHGV